MLESDEESESLRFDPPVYRQRYNFVYKMLNEPRWCHDMKKVLSVYTIVFCYLSSDALHRPQVVEFGCADMDLIKFLKPLQSITSILEVDCDEALLIKNSFKAQPLNRDYLAQRESPLHIKVRYNIVKHSKRHSKTPRCRYCTAAYAIPITD